MFSQLEVNTTRCSTALVQLKHSASVTVSDSMFFLSNQPIFLQKNYNLTIENSIIANSNSVMSAIHIEGGFEQVYLHLSNVSFIDNIAEYPADIYIESIETSLVEFYIENSLFQGSQGARALSIGSKESAYITTGIFERCIFNSLNPTSYNGVITLLAYKADIYFRECEFSNIIGSSDVHTSIVFSNIGNLWDSERNYVEFSGTIFTENKLTVLITQESKFLKQGLILSNCSFIGNQGNILNLLNSGALVENSYFYQNINNEMPLIQIQESNSFLTIRNTKFIGNIGSGSLELISATRNTEINIEGVVIESNVYETTNLIQLHGGIINFSHSTITSNKSNFGFYALDSNVSINNVTFSNNDVRVSNVFEFTTVSGTSLNCISEALCINSASSNLDLSVSISQCILGIVADKSTISLNSVDIIHTQTPVISTGCSLTMSNGRISSFTETMSFSETTASLQFTSIEHSTGSTYIEASTINLENFTLKSSNSMHFSNTEISLLNSNVHGNIESSFLLTDSVLTAIDSEFSFNTAVAGSCLHMRNSSATINSSIFTNNTAEKGGAIYHEDSDISIKNTVFSDNTALHGVDIATNPISLTHYDDYSSPLKSGSLIENLTFYIIDEYGQVAVTHTDVGAQILGKSNDTVIKGGTKTLSNAGVLIFYDVRIYQTPNTNSSLSVSISTLEITSYTLDLSFRACQLGEIFQPDNSCESCMNNTYSLSLTDVSCNACPAEAYCLGDDKLFPKEGYWRASYSEPIFYSCPNKEACIGGTTSYKGECGEGYGGNLCAVCSGSYQPGSGYSCKVCPDSIVSYTLIVVSLLVLIVFFVLLIVFKIKGAKKASSDIPLLVKIMMNYIQTIMLFSAFNVSWPPIMISFINFSIIAGNPSSELISLRCTEANYFGDLEMTLQELMLLNMVPFITIFMSCAVWGILAWRRRKLEFLKVNLMSTSVILLLFLHSSVTNGLFSLFGCNEVGGEYWMTADYSIQCWEGNHLDLAIFLGVPGLALWCGLLPGLAFYFLFTSRHVLHKDETKVKYKTLYSGYKRSFFFWELVVISRKVLIRAVAVILVSYPTMVQGLTAVVVLCIMGYLQVCFDPFENQKINRLEFLSISVCSLTLLCGVFYNENLGSGFELFLSYSVMSINVMFILTWVSYVVKALLKNRTSNKVLGKLVDKLNVIKEKISSSLGSRRGSQVQDSTINVSVSPFNTVFNAEFTLSALPEVQPPAVPAPENSSDEEDNSNE